MNRNVILLLASFALATVACATQTESGGPSESNAEQPLGAEAVAPPAPSESALEALKAAAPGKIASKKSSAQILDEDCWQSNGKWLCNNAVCCPVFRSGTNEVIDHLCTDPSVFVCRAEGNHNNNGPHPNRWEWTQGDETGSFGWVTDSCIASETDPLPQC